LNYPENLFNQFYTPKNPNVVGAVAVKAFGEAV
jgi:hypothetical protein